MIPFYTIAAPAKINLSLRIIAKREDGYHDLESLVGFADFGDVLRFEIAPKDSIAIDGEFARLAPGNPDNLILKTLDKLRASAPDLPNFHIHLQKNIPVGGGVGGGSADAASVIRFVRDYYSDLFKPGFNWMDLAHNIGADVPVCVESKPCIMRGVGEKIEFTSNFAPKRGVLLFPNISVPTKNIFAAWNGKSRVKTIHPTTQFNNDNDLFTPAALIHPELGAIANKLAKTTHKGWGMSGSGSCFYLLAEDTKAQQQLLGDVRNLFPDYWIKPIVIAGN